MIEWARLLLADISRILGTPGPTLLGDTRCTGFDSSGTPNYEASNQPGPDYVGCSGIEGMILPNAAVSYGTVALDFSGDPNPLPNTTPAGSYPGNNADVFGIYGSLLKPGDEFGAFCVDPGVESDCISNSGVSIFQNALTAVARVLGGGVQANLPAELQDRRYYFKWFGIAYVKYLKAYGNYALANPTTVNMMPSSGSSAQASRPPTSTPSRSTSSRCSSTTRSRARARSTSSSTSTASSSARARAAPTTGSPGTSSTAATSSVATSATTTGTAAWTARRSRCSPRCWPTRRPTRRVSRTTSTSPTCSAARSSAATPWQASRACSRATRAPSARPVTPRPTAAT